MVEKPVVVGIEPFLGEDGKHVTNIRFSMYTVRWYMPSNPTKTLTNTILVSKPSVATGIIDPKTNCFGFIKQIRGTKIWLAEKEGVEELWELEFSAGLIEKGEDAQSAGKREAKEEANLQIYGQKPLDKSPNRGDVAVSTESHGLELGYAGMFKKGILDQMEVIAPDKVWIPIEETFHRLQSTMKTGEPFYTEEYSDGSIAKFELSGHARDVLLALFFLVNLECIPLMTDRTLEFMNS